MKCAIIISREERKFESKSIWAESRWQHGRKRNDAKEC